MPKGAREAVASAARYIPTPETVGVTRRLMQLKARVGVFQQAIVGVQAARRKRDWEKITAEKAASMVAPVKAPVAGPAPNLTSR